MLRRLGVIAAAMTVVMLLLIPAASAGNVRTYEVTITNLTGGQPLTPPLAATHKKNVDLWEVGDPASLALQALAENGNTVPLQGWLDGHKKVWTTWKAAAPLVPTMDPGKTGFSDTVTFTITAAKGAKYLSVASMLICTNDGFTGVNGLRLPKKIGDSKTVMPNAYDAGTEINTEDFADIVPRLLHQLGEGIDDTGVRPGIIGEIGTSETLFDCERSILRAAARAGAATGTAVNVHCHPPELEVVIEIVDLLTGEGLDPTRIYLSHLDEIVNLDYHTALLDRGVVIGFDSFGQDGYFSPSWKSLSDLEKMTTTARLIDAGFGDQLVLAQDIGKKHYLRAFGGMGYDHVLSRVVPRMQEMFAVTDEAVEAMLIGTPRRLLARDGDG